MANTRDSLALLTFSWAVGTVYPIFASYKAFDTYTVLASKCAATTVNISGVSIPLGTMLKRATAPKPTTLEEDTLNARLLTVQMWMIFWIVSGAIRIVETVLFVSVLPLYLVARLCLSVWLVAPIVMYSTRHKKPLTESDIHNEWVAFLCMGCGWVYFQYIKPLMEGQLAFLSVGFDGVEAQVGWLLSIPWSLLAKMGGARGEDPVRNTRVPSGNIRVPSGGSRVPSGSSVNNEARSGGDGVSGEASGAEFMQAFGAFRAYFPSRTVVTEELDEYDVVDTPDMAASELRTRKDAVAKSDATRRRWLW